MPIAYPIELSKHRRAVRVTFPDLPEASVECPAGEQMHVAGACLADTLERYIRDRRAIPAPSPIRGRRLVEPPLLIAAKVALYEAMRENGLSNVALARELGTVEGTVRRLIDLRHRSHVDQVEAALANLGKRLLVTVRRL